MRKVPLTPEKLGFEKIPQSKNAENSENAENADTKKRKMWKKWKKRLTGFNVTGFRSPPPHLWARECPKELGWQLSASLLDVLF